MPCAVPHVGLSCCTICAPSVLCSCVWPRLRVAGMPGTGSVSFPVPALSVACRCVPAGVCLGPHLVMLLLRHLGSLRLLLLLVLLLRHARGHALLGRGEAGR